MPHFPHTPEALLRRNDSKDASRTCRGITASGRACRRALASPRPSPVGGKIVEYSAVPSTENCASYCWQHQDQAQLRDDPTKSDEESSRRTRPGIAGLKTLQERSSIDTLVQKLGINSSDTERPNKRAVPVRDVRQHPYSSNKDRTGAGRAARRSKNGRSFWATLCCIGSADDDDYVEIVRHKKRLQRVQQPVPPSVAPVPFLVSAPMAEAKPQQEQNRVASNPRQLQTPASHPTRHLLSLIPSHLSPSTTSTLLTELSKPISPYDEDGYIYIFWLTPQSKERPGDSTARAILSPPGARPWNSRRISDVMTEYSFQEGITTRDRRGTDGKRTIVLKIGRASNITRRMNEWQRQCGYALNLVRWYPHVPSSNSNPTTPQPSPQHRPSEPLYPDLSRPPPSRGQSESVQKCPHVHRVERLIHIELAERQVKRQCNACCKEHREWFEVEATQAGVKAIDETIRRWVMWAEQQR